jgi:hypothetical protein
MKLESIQISKKLPSITTQPNSREIDDIQRMHFDASMLVAVATFCFAQFGMLVSVVGICRKYLIELDHHPPRHSQTSSPNHTPRARAG